MNATSKQANEEAGDQLNHAMTEHAEAEPDPRQSASRRGAASRRLEFDESAGRELLERAKTIRPLLVKNALLNEQRGELTEVVIDALIEIRAFDMAIPHRWGGLCLSANAMARIAAEIAKGCPSSSWVVTITNSNAWLATNTPDRMQEAIFGRGIVRICGVSNPPGKIDRVADGYRVSGRWPYASGSHHAQLAYCPVKSAQGEDGVVVMPMTQLSIEKTWLVTGMKGSGSDTILAAEVFVPEACYCSVDEVLVADRSTRKHFGEATDYWPALPLLRAKVLGVLVGIAEGLFEAVAETTKAKPLLQTTYARKMDSQVYQAGIGESSAKIAGARILMEETTTRIDAAARSKLAMSYAERTEIRALGALAVDLLTSAVDKLMTVAGSGAFSETGIAQRYWRDFSIGARHTALIPAVGYEVQGRQILGVEPNIIPLPMI
jgi:3-hydroxy-9,10-secoandrosta-1,3,5(10)-triene-9,17-dione monooxygenase